MKNHVTMDFEGISMQQLSLEQKFMLACAFTFVNYYGTSATGTWREKCLDGKLKFNMVRYAFDSAQKYYPVMHGTQNSHDLVLFKHYPTLEERAILNPSYRGEERLINPHDLLDIYNAFVKRVDTVFKEMDCSKVGEIYSDNHNNWGFHLPAMERAITVAVNAALLVRSTETHTENRNEVFIRAGDNGGSIFLTTQSRFNKCEQHFILPENALHPLRTFSVNVQTQSDQAPRAIRFPTSCNATLTLDNKYGDGITSILSMPNYGFDLMFAGADLCRIRRSFVYID